MSEDRSASIEIVAKMPPKRGWRYWVDVGLSMPGMTRPGEEEHETAWVVARNRLGDERQLFAATVAEVEKKRARVETELGQMPFDAWCERYDVPPEFARS